MKPKHRGFLFGQRTLVSQSFIETQAYMVYNSSLTMNAYEENNENCHNFLQSQFH
jgi:hypothetical protein